MRRIVYISTASITDDEEIRKTLAAAVSKVSKNKTLNITGLLAFNGVKFLQVLEGDDQTLKDVTQTSSTIIDIPG